jgi:phage tail protein X
MSMRTYRTVQGDTWDGIALKMYPDRGGEKLMHVLLEANPMHRETVVFEANFTLNIPEIEISVVSTLPPWKRR